MRRKFNLPQVMAIIEYFCHTHSGSCQSSKFRAHTRSSQRLLASFGAALPPPVRHFALTDPVLGTKSSILLTTFISWWDQNPIIKTAEPYPQVCARNTELPSLKSTIKISKVQRVYVIFLDAFLLFLFI